MTGPALALAPARLERRCHAERAEYFGWLHEVFANSTPRPDGDIPVIKSRRYYYNRFLKHWPDLEDWFAEPLLVRLDLHERDQWQSGKRTGTSQDAGPYLTYLSLVHGHGLDADFVLSRNFDSMLHPNIAAGLGLDVALVRTWIDRMRQLGYQDSIAAALTWPLCRLVLWRGDPDLTAITAEDIREFGQHVRRYCAGPDAGFIRTTHVSNARRHEDPAKLAAQFEAACLTRLYALHVLLFNVGQVGEQPIYGLRHTEKWRDQLTPTGTPPAIAAPVERWLELRLASTDRSGSVRGARDGFRYLITWLIAEHPEITNLAELTRTHLEDYMLHLHRHINPRNEQPRAPATPTSARCCSSSARPRSGAGTTCPTGRCSAVPTCPSCPPGCPGSSPAPSSTGSWKRSKPWKIPTSAPRYCCCAGAAPAAARSPA